MTNKNAKIKSEYTVYKIYKKYYIYFETLSLSLFNRSVLPYTILFNSVYKHKSIDRIDIDRLLKNVPCEILYKAKMSVGVKELVNFLDRDV